jgi:RimJ/RimL family protein N-acetyltransferase
MLVGNDVVLRAWREDDIAVLMRLRNDVSLQTQLMTQPRPNSRVRVSQWLKEWSERTDGVFFVVAAADDDHVLGYVQLANMDVMHGRGDLGICLDQAVHGHGVADQTMELLQNYVIQVFGLRKILLHVLCSNLRAIAFYEKQGFKRVGVLREHAFLQGGHVDVLLMDKLL